MPRPIHVLNGPNLNRLGSASRRSTAGRRSPRSRRCAAARRRPSHGLPPDQFEGELVGWIHEAIDEGAGIVINPAGLSFTSIPCSTP